MANEQRTVGTCSSCGEVRLLRFDRSFRRCACGHVEPEEIESEKVEPEKVEPT